MQLYTWLSQHTHTHTHTHTYTDKLSTLPMTSSSVTKTLPLFTGAEKKHGDRFLNEVEKNSKQRGPQKTNTLKTV